MHSAYTSPLHLDSISRHAKCTIVCSNIEPYASLSDDQLKTANNWTDYFSLDPSNIQGLGDYESVKKAGARVLRCDSPINVTSLSEVSSFLSIV